MSRALHPGHQLEDLLFAEINYWMQKIKYEPVKKALQTRKLKVFIEGNPHWYIVGRTIPKDTNDKLGDVLSGFHSGNLLFIIDEASGVADAVFAGLEGSMAQQAAYALLVGNPTRPDGYFYNSHNKFSSAWSCVTLSGYDSPINSRENLDRLVELHGEDSDWVRTKILGEFPTGAGQVVATYEQVEEAHERWRNYDKNELSGPLVAGLDPGAGRKDSSILTFRRGNYIWEPIRITHTDIPQLHAKIPKILRRWNCREFITEYDGVGISVYDYMRRQSGFKTFKVVMTGRANDPEAYRNTRAELYKQLSDNIDELCLPPHERYMSEMPEIAFLQDKTPLQVMDKKQIKSRLGYSTDFTDSLLMTTARHFNLGLTNTSNHDILAYKLMNDQLVSETGFVKI